MKLYLKRTMAMRMTMTFDLKFLILSFILICTISTINTSNTIKTSDIPRIYGPLDYESDQEVKQHFTNLRNYLLSETSANKNTNSTFNKNNFLTSKSYFEPHHDSLLCKGCLYFYNSLQSLLLKKYGWHIFFDFLSVLCAIGVDYRTCHDYINAYGGIVIENIIDHYFNGEFICTFTGICETDHFIPLTADDYAKEILGEISNVSKSGGEIDLEAKVWKVLQVTDIHVDMKYKEGSRGVCAHQLCCRSENLGNLGKNEKNLKFLETDITTSAGKWGFLGKCDIPLVTLLNFSEKVFKEIQPDFIIWTGDNPAHDAYDGSAFEVAKAFTDIIKIQHKYSLPVYPSLGNHEKFPADEYNPFKSESEFLTQYADLWKDWLGEDAYKTFKQFGGYSKKHNDTNLRIVSLNCMLCDVVNFNLMKDPTDPQSQIEWLERVLHKAEEDGEVVYLISHIPPGDSSFLSECARRVKVLLDRYSYIIRGQFYGHTHYDEIKVTTGYYDKEKVTGVSFIAPSLTTYSHLNPSFRIFEVDSNTKIIRDYLQYRLDINKANANTLANIDYTPEWEIAYRATELFNVKFLNDFASLLKFTRDIETDKKVFNRVLDSFFTGGPLVTEYASLSKMPLCLSCRFRLDVFDDYYKCIGYFTWDAQEYAYKLINAIEGSWFKKLPD